MFGSGLHVAVSKRSNFQALGSVWLGLTRGGVERSNFQASGCVWVGLTHGGDEKL